MNWTVSGFGEDASVMLQLLQSSPMKRLSIRTENSCLLKQIVHNLFRVHSHCRFRKSARWPSTNLVTQQESEFWQIHFSKAPVSVLIWPSVALHTRKPGAVTNWLHWREDTWLDRLESLLLRRVRPQNQKLFRSKGLAFRVSVRDKTKHYRDSLLCKEHKT